MASSLVRSTVAAQAPEARSAWGKVVGCYLHGSLLPKNPWLADRLIGWALERRHGTVDLAPLDDAAEAAARDQATEVARARP